MFVSEETAFLRNDGVSVLFGTLLILLPLFSLSVSFSRSSQSDSRLLVGDSRNSWVERVRSMNGRIQVEHPGIFYI